MPLIIFVSSSFNTYVNLPKKKENIVTDALSRRYVLLNTMNTRLLGFAYVKELYDNNSDIADNYNACGHSAFGKFYLMDGYLFKEYCVFLLVLCVTRLLHEYFYWLKMKRVAQRIYEQCLCLLNLGSISMEFVLER